MKIRLSLVLLNILFLTVCFVNEQVTSNENVKGDQSGKADEAKLEENMNQLVITINQETFKITLYENETTAALLEQLPLSLSMEDLHRNEKYVALDESLPTQSERVQSISTGDFMLYGSNTLVLFMKISQPHTHIQD
ncbi:hypothetical protein JCM19046_3437 [Bacillus sp. JCM 19046]|nr:hypothetical protein JCM19046_3437 [Bacillus sp. JCM 19046]